MEDMITELNRAQQQTLVQPEENKSYIQSQGETFHSENSL